MPINVTHILLFSMVAYQTNKQYVQSPLILSGIWIYFIDQYFLIGPFKGNKGKGRKDMNQS